MKKKIAFLRQKWLYNALKAPENARLEFSEPGIELFEPGENGFEPSSFRAEPRLDSIPTGQCPAQGPAQGPRIVSVQQN